MYIPRALAFPSNLHSTGCLWVHNRRMRLARKTFDLRFIALGPMKSVLVLPAALVLASFSLAMATSQLCTWRSKFCREACLMRAVAR